MPTLRVRRPRRFSVDLADGDISDADRGIIEKDLPAIFEGRLEIRTQVHDKFGPSFDGPNPFHFLNHMGR